MEELKTILAQPVSVMTKQLASLSVSSLAAMLIQNSGNGTIMHRLASTGEIEAIDMICQSLSEAAVVDILMITTTGGQTALHEAASKDQVVVIHCLLERIGSEDGFTILMLKDVGGATALHTAASKSHVRSVSCLLNFLTSQQRFELLNVANSRGETVIDRFFECSTETKKELQKYFQAARVYVVNRSLNKEKRFPSKKMDTKLLDGMLASFNVKDSKEALDYILSKMRVSPDVDRDVLRAILEAVPEPDRLCVLRTHNILGSALHCAASRGENSLVLCILDFLQPNNIHLVLKISRDDGSTILHTCFYDNNTVILSKVFDLVSEADALKLLRMKDTAGLTCIDYAVQKEHSAVLKLMLDKVSVDALLLKGLLRTANKNQLPESLKDKSEIVVALFGIKENAQTDLVKNSYSKWMRQEPIPCGVTKLSKLGLRYIGMDDLVNCGHCKETFHLLSRSDLKLERHLNAQPGSCVEEQDEKTSKAGKSQLAEEDQISFDEAPTNPSESRKFVVGPKSEKAPHHYDKFERRLESMQKLKSKDSMSINLYKLAKIGCYYTGISDLVQCIICKGRFKLQSNTDRDKQQLELHSGGESCTMKRLSGNDYHLETNNCEVFIKCLQLEKILADLRLPEQPLAKQEMLRSRLLAVPSGKRLTQLMRSNDLGSIMHKMAAIEEAEDIIECITKSVERQDYFRLMKIQDECGQTALHVAARNNHLLAVVCMLEHLLPVDRVRILEMRDTGHLTAFYHLAKDELNCDWIILNLLPLIEVQYLEKFFEVQLYTNQELSVTMIETLSAYRESLTITPPPDIQKLRELIHNDDRASLKSFMRQCENKQTAIDEATKLPLTSEQIEDLSQYSEHYVIPDDQTHCRRQAMIFYCAKDRVGAEEEAEKMGAALRAVGFNTQMEEWHNFYRLRLMMREKIADIREKTSVLFVCVMSHGIRGHVHGNDENYGSINTVMYDMRCEIPDYIPMILMVQACQTTQSEDDLNHQTDNQQAEYHINFHRPAADTEHIILRRPHTALLLSTIPGGRSIRGLYTSALAVVLSKLEGKHDLRTIHSAAVRRIKRNIDYAEYEQIPEYRDTFDKTLFVCGAHN